MTEKPTGIYAGILALGGYSALRTCNLEPRRQRDKKLFTFWGYDVSWF